MLFGKFKGKSVCETWLVDGVDGSESVSGNDDSVVPEEISIGSFTMFGSPCVYECVVQYSGLSVVSGGLKGFSWIFCDVGVEPRQSEGIFEVLCCEKSVGVSGSVLLESSEVLVLVIGVYQNELWGFENSISSRV